MPCLASERSCQPEHMTGAASDQRTVIVGFDGSDHSRHALLWALDKQERLGSVRPVMAATGDTAPRMDDLDAIRPGLADATTIIDSAAGPALVDASKSASLLVVGTRGRSTLEEAVLGSVASYCVKHSEVPVAIVPSVMPIDSPLSIAVVGIDGSAGSQAALGWALEHLEATGTVIALGGAPAIVFFPDTSDPDADPVERFTRQRVEQTVALVRERYDEVPRVEIRVTGEDVKDELRKAADDADLLVVGSRWHHGARRLTHRSVAVSVAHHPRVTTVVVPPSPAEPEAP